MSFDRRALIFRGRIFCEIAPEAQAGFKPILATTALRASAARSGSEGTLEILCRDTGPNR